MPSASVQAVAGCGEASGKSGRLDTLDADTLPWDAIALQTRLCILGFEARLSRRVCLEAACSQETGDFPKRKNIGVFPNFAEQHTPREAADTDSPKPCADARIAGVPRPYETSNPPRTTIGP